MIILTVQCCCIVHVGIVLQLYIHTMHNVAITPKGPCNARLESIVNIANGHISLLEAHNVKNKAKK